MQPPKNSQGPGRPYTGWPGPPFSSGRVGGVVPRAIAVPATSPVAEIRSPSTFLAVSKGRSLIGRGPGHATHARTELCRPSDLFGPTEVNPQGAIAPGFTRAENPAPPAADSSGLRTHPHPIHRSLSADQRTQSRSGTENSNDCTT